VHAFRVRTSGAAWSYPTGGPVSCTPAVAGGTVYIGSDDGYVFIAFRPDLLVPLAELRRELGALIARVKAVPCQPGFAEIRIPGEQSARNRQRLTADGLDIDRLVYDRLGALAG